MIEIGFCLWCREEKRLSLGKQICYACEDKGADIVQLEQQAQKAQEKQEQEELKKQLNQKLITYLTQRKEKITQEITLLKGALNHE